MLKLEFDHALQLFNAQRLHEVVQFCEPRQQHPMFKLLLATTFGKLADYPKAEQIFLQLQQQYPEHLDVLFNFALVKKLQGQLDTAQALLQRCLTLNAGYHPAQHLLASVYRQQGHAALAIPHFTQALRLAPDNVSYLYDAAECHVAVAEFQTAFVQLNHLLAQALHQPALRLLALVLYKLQQCPVMRAMRQRYQAQIQHDPEILLYAGLLELDEKCYQSALSLLLQAQQLQPSADFETDANVLYCRYLLSPNAQYLDELQTLANTVDTAESYLFVANLLETLGSLDDVASLLALALAKFPQSAGLLLIQAKVLTRQKAHAKALAVLAQINTAEDAGVALDVIYQKIQLFEALGDYASAADEIKQAAERHQHSSMMAGFQQELHRAHADLACAAEPIAGHPRVLNFIIGFPRSGTTLLESRLAACKDVKILEETYAVKHFYSHLQQLAQGQSVMAYVQSLAVSDRLNLAEQFLASLQSYGDFTEQHIIVDKMPLNALYLSPLLLLFPNATIVVMTRHPMDVCLSSLKQRMINLYCVAHFAESYHGYFSLLEQFVAHFATRVLTIQYEALVTDYANVFAEVLQHMGIHHHQQTSSAAPMMFNTPSYHQVSQPLYTKSMNGFVHYQPFFDFQHPLLLAWCKKLGYAT